MESLGVRPPDVVTRVTEYVPQIVHFVEAIVAKGLAYASAAGSVYLSLEAFKAQGHTYRKLKPFAGDTSEADMAEGEGALGGAEAGEKQHPNDFALWKASKPGEPSWPSPWGAGRPGWHIECSVIASDILGPNLDVHAGGVDLKFPHHDNELAQAEAFYGHSQWVNYFFHAGHLDIKGLKMSKSLKNFITIQQALEKHSARQIRLMFLLQPWDKGMNYSDQTMQDAKAKEAVFRNFFGAVKAVLSEPAPTGSANSSAWLSKPVGWTNPGPAAAAAAAVGSSSSSGGGGPATGNSRRPASAGSAAGSLEKALALCLAACGDAVHAAFCRNFDTPAAVGALCTLVAEVNKYVAAVSACGGSPSAPLLRKCAAKVTSVLRLLGVVEGADALGFPLSGLLAGGGGSGQGGGSGERGGAAELLGPYLDAFRDFRHEVLYTHVCWSDRGEEQKA
jgi:cysteinyl-tRNA synthetase